ncbi:malonyl-ACP O-methyltransferase BioC [Candidatus Marithioploca araucensis]|uniref:Malonyl-[acyl-carrier protein] O-methyltransferase n=1 Tax=Candidatus Marithioploca araucensis TaxID=70273 RepID=A0ABT7VS76_9GAMM|nr:malonyl-ACP O-methyltransferase BioC [Candidatus Marithioploca araucensis]
MLLPEYLDKQHVSQSFDRAAPIYEEWITVQKIAEENLLERLEWLKMAPQQILDVGSGAGRLTYALNQQYKAARIYGIDISTKMLQVASKKRLGEASQPFFLCADAAQLPIADNSIDLLISNMMLQWCNDIQAVFSEFARVLKPDGALFFSSLGPDTLKELRNSWATVDNASHVNRFIDMHHYGDALLQAGLCNPVLDVDRLELSYRDVKQLMRELKNVGAHNIMVGRAKGLMGKGKFKQMLTAYEEYRSPEGFLPATYEVVYGHALGKIEPFSENEAIPIVTHF